MSGEHGHVEGCLSCAGTAKGVFQAGVLLGLCAQGCQEGVNYPGLLALSESVNGQPLVFPVRTFLAVCGAQDYALVLFPVGPPLRGLDSVWFCSQIGFELRSAVNGCSDAETQMPLSGPDHRRSNKGNLPLPLTSSLSLPPAISYCT
jgi:hypothetical protein